MRIPLSGTPPPPRQPVPAIPAASAGPSARSPSIEAEPPSARSFATQSARAPPPPLRIRPENRVRHAGIEVEKIVCKRSFAREFEADPPHEGVAGKNRPPAFDLEA